MSFALPVKRLPHAQDLPLPSYATLQSAGLDLIAANDTTIILAPGQWQLIPTGLAIALPAGYEAQVRPRSGLAFKYGVTVLNAPGTIDADYRGEVKVLLINHGQEDFTIERGMRIAQLIIAPYITTTLHESEQIEDTARGAGGFGSTGVKINA